MFSFPVDFLLFDKGDIFCDFSFPAFQASSEKGSTLKGKNLLPTWTNSFLLEWTHFLKGGKTVLTELPSLKLHLLSTRILDFHVVNQILISMLLTAYFSFHVVNHILVPMLLTTPLSLHVINHGFSFPCYYPVF